MSDFVCMNPVEPQDKLPVAHAEPALLEQLCQAQGLFDSVVDGLLAVDHRGRVLFCGAIARGLLGEDLVSLTPEICAQRYSFLLEDGSPPEDIMEVPLVRALKGEAFTRQDTFITGRGLREVWVSVTARPIHTPQGEFDWTYMVLRDSNLRKWSEERMHLFERAVESTGEGMVIIDARHPDQPIVHVNPAFEHATGRPAHQVIGLHWRALLGQEEQCIEAAIADADFQRGVPFTAELEGRRLGEPAWFRLSLTAVLSPAKIVTHYIAVVSDISALKETEARLQGANRKLEVAYERIKRNLDAAASLQQALLPTSMPEVPGIGFDWFFEPAEELSGDILNIIQLDEEHVALYLLDVSGHGVAPAMLSVMVNRALIPIKSNTALLYEAPDADGVFHVADPAHVAVRLGMRFPWRPEVGYFFTMIYGVLHIPSRQFRYVCAGHEPPMLLRPDGEFVSTPSPNFPIGLGDNHFEEQIVQLEAGGRLILFSDGVTETWTPEHKLFGKKRLRNSFRESQKLPLEESVSALAKALKTWRGDEAPHDDVSLVAVEVE
jgi:phosphoserine phosphatase RsbU/P